MTWYEGSDAFAVLAVSVHSAIASALMFMCPLYKSVPHLGHLSQKSLNVPLSFTPVKKINSDLL